MHRYIDGLPLQNWYDVIWEPQELFLRDGIQGVRGDEDEHDWEQHHLPQQVDNIVIIMVGRVMAVCFLSVKIDKTPIYKLVLRNFTFFQNQIAITLQLSQDMYHWGEYAGPIQRGCPKVVRKHKKGDFCNFYGLQIQIQANTK